jgi:hypothetical protein
MRVFKTKWFSQWMKKSELNDRDLIQAVQEMEQGLIDANLGEGVYKKRVAIKGRGKSKGVRTIVAYQQENNAFFIYAFEKKARANINEKERKALKLLGDELLGYGEQTINKALKAGELIEVDYDSQ